MTQPHSNDTPNRDIKSSIDRRQFIATTSAIAAASAILPAGSQLAAASVDSAATLATDAGLAATGADSMYFGHQWQSLNPGYWQIKDGALRRRLTNYGDRARATGFPFHGATHGPDFQIDYDPSLPAGIAYRPQWYLNESYTITAEFTYHADRPSIPAGDEPNWKMHQDGFGLMGIAIGGKHLMESFHQVRSAVIVAWTDAGRLEVIMPPKKKGFRGQRNVMPDRPAMGVDAFLLQPGDRCQVTVTVSPAANGTSKLIAALVRGSDKQTFETTLPSQHTTGYAGVAGQGQIDFSVNEFKIDAPEVKPRTVGVNDCYSCYPLGDTLKRSQGNWQVKFVGLFASAGKLAELRIADSPQPTGGWELVPVCAAAKIIDNQWRRNTAILHATLPHDPAEKTMYYTVWKDGKNVTADGRIGTDACGPGTGLVGDVPNSGAYVGRLPQLKAPYKVCGLSCHAITANLQEPTAEGGWKMNPDGWAVRDQPTRGAFQHLDDYDFQIMLWEDDVWYMELVMYPPSTDDAYKIVTHSICGPTSRWQMMRHWNVINPGDHDFGMDDVKGPEQIVIRNKEGLGQDRDYMRRNFQIVHHLVTAAEEVDPTVNLKNWRAWKMPNRDFTLIVCDSRMWRSSQDVDMWDDAGWEKFQSLYDRTDPTRSLLGEEQFGWLQEQLATDSSPIICLTGISGLHTVWGGAKSRSDRQLSETHPKRFHQRDRVTADYAGWVKAGADRVLELLGSRDGVVTVYGDVHNGCLMKNKQQRVIECSFGPIGRTGGRQVIPGFGKSMKDVDDRELDVFALYHRQWADADLNRRQPTEPEYWNFLEMEFDPRAHDGRIEMRIRNLIDAPTDPLRGGGQINDRVSNTGRPILSSVPELKTLPNADVRFTTVEGKPLRATRSNNDGIAKIVGLPDVQPGTAVVVTTYDGKQTVANIVTTTEARG